MFSIIQTIHHALFHHFLQVPIDVFKGITDEDAAKVVDGLAPKVADRNASIEQVKKLYNLFRESDCTQLEVRINFTLKFRLPFLFFASPYLGVKFSVLLQINPIAETSDNKLVAADAKLNFDDNAAFRQKEIFALRDPTQEDPREV